MQVNIVINATTTSGKTLNTTISYVNPQATNAKLLELADTLNDLTTNSYAHTTKETKEEL